MPKKMNFKEVDTYSVFRVSVSNSDYNLLRELLDLKAKEISSGSFIVDVTEYNSVQSETIKEHFDTLYEVAVKDNQAEFIEIEISGH